jgi:AcrR family transcriptional regulator
MIVHSRKRSWPVPRITPERRAANRSLIVAAARRCFSRDGFHQTSMPDIAAEAGVSVGAPYRYFTSKEEIILEIAGDAFRVIFDPIAHSAAAPAQVADLVAAAINPVTATDPDRTAPVDELLRCAVQAWGELLRHEGLRHHAQTGFDRVRDRIAEALRNGQKSGSVPPELDADSGARVVIALLHGFVLQHTAFGLTDPAGFTHAIRHLLGDAGLIRDR